MKTNNRLEKSFGPVGTSAGVLMFIVGVIATFTSFYGLILIVIGAFIGFTSTSTIIDFDRRRVKFSNNFFGIIRIGNWMKINASMKIGIKKSNKVWRAYSMSNRTLDIESDNFRIILYNSDNKQIMPLQKADSLASAQTEQGILGHHLGLK